MPQSATSRLPDPKSAYAVRFSPEIDLLLACCGAESRGESSIRIQAILTRNQTEIDWKRLSQLAQRHGLAPFLHRRLSIAMDPIQPAWLGELGWHDKVNAHRTLWLTLELLNIHKHLAARGLTVLPYKGPVLAESLYGNVALRQFSDLDLLVRARDLPAVRSALIELGYKPGLELPRAAERAYLKSGYEYTFDGAQGRNLVEVKWQILPRFYSVDFNLDDFFARAVTVIVAGQELRTLCEQDLMLVLCAHVAKHGWTQLSWLCDIVQLAQSRSLDWEALRTQAERLGIARMVAVSFLLAQKLFGSAPPSQLNLGGDPAAEALAERVLRQIIAEGEFDPASPGYFRLMMNLRERLRDRVSFVWRLCVTPGAREWAAVRLPGPLFPLYRVVRLFRLAGRIVGAILRA